VAVEIYNFSELISLIIIFILNFIIIIKLSKYFKLTTKEALSLYMWHSIFAFFFLINDINHGHDASGWYTRGNIDKIGYFSNEFMYFFSGLLKEMKIKYLAQNVIFNSFGTIAIMIFYSALKQLCKYKNNRNFFPIILILVLLPGLSFWSSGITKDVLSIFALSTLYFSIKNKFNLNLFIFSIFVICLSRFFLIVFFIFGAYIFTLISVFLTNKISKNKKIIINISLLLVLIPTIYSLNIVSLFTSKIDPSLNIFNLIQQSYNYISSSQTYYSETFYGIPIDTNYFIRMLSFLYKPFIGDPVSLFSGYFILENIFLLMLTFVILLNIEFNPKNINNITKIFYVSILLMFYFFSLSISNFGIALRYKWMIIPFLVLAFLDLRKTNLKH
jgi:hypothetical protein